MAALGRAIVHAADLGARVIAISAITCLPADRNVDQGALGAAIRYAAVDKDAVIVAAAGNSGSAGSASSGAACESNPLTDLGRPEDPRNWAGVTSVSVPSWWQPYVLSVGSLTPADQPSKFTMAGPWVGIAAPGENIVSVSNRDDGGLANGLPNEHQQLVPLIGTSYAAGYVSGVAALVRSKYPELNAGQVIQRITATAHNGARAPSNVVGAGTVDPVAALTWELPAATNDDAVAGETRCGAAGTGTEEPGAADRRIRRDRGPHFGRRSRRRDRRTPTKGAHAVSAHQSISPPTGRITLVLLAVVAAAIAFPWHSVRERWVLGVAIVVVIVLLARWQGLPVTTILRRRLAILRPTAAHVGPSESGHRRADYRAAARHPAGRRSRRRCRCR